MGYWNRKMILGNKIRKSEKKRQTLTNNNIQNAILKSSRLKKILKSSKMKEMAFIENVEKIIFMDNLFQKFHYISNNNFRKQNKKKWRLRNTSTKKQQENHIRKSQVFIYNRGWGDMWLKMNVKKNLHINTI